MHHDLLATILIGMILESVWSVSDVIWELQISFSSIGITKIFGFVLYCRSCPSMVIFGQKFLGFISSGERCVFSFRFWDYYIPFCYPLSYNVNSFLFNIWRCTLIFLELNHMNVMNTKMDYILTWPAVKLKAWFAFITVNYLGTMWNRVLKQISDERYHMPANATLYKNAKLLVVNMVLICWTGHLHSHCLKGCLWAQWWMSSCKMSFYLCYVNVNFLCCKCSRSNYFMNPSDENL